MCSVVGYIGKSLSQKFIFQGLARLEYRGYDAAGFACLEPISNKIVYAKSSGQLNNLVAQIQEQPIDGFLGIGHTRWSTHGDCSQKNSHPHFDCTQTISVVHNGIIENHHALRKELELLGHVFQSSTDTEVITHLFETLLKKNTLHKSIQLLVQQLHGSYAFVIMMEQYPDMLLVVRKRSPLCVGIGNNEMFIASDSVAFAGDVESVFFLPDNSFAYVHKSSLQVYSFSGELIVPIMQAADILFSATEKGQYEHFMLKEIYEQRGAIEKTVTALSLLQSALWDQLGIAYDDIKNIERIAFIGCGTSWHAARIAQFFFESIVGVPVDVYLASELRYMPFFPRNTTFYIFISQSGETADTLEALNMVNLCAAHYTVTLSNSPTSTMVREARGYLLTHAGVEIAVASTKAFSTQLAALYWLAHRIALAQDKIDMNDMCVAETNLIDASQLLETVLEKYRQSIELHIAPRYATYDKMLFLGKHISYPFALESALKLKEIAYVFAECHPSGELKHGSLALVDETVPVFIFSHQDSLIYQKLLSNAHAVHSRGGKIVAFAYEGQEELCGLAETFFVIPSHLPSLLGPLVMTGVMQFLMYCIARERGCPIDKPRNLAKSVTVE